MIFCTDFCPDFDDLNQLTTTELAQIISEQALMADNHLLNYPAQDSELPCVKEFTAYLCNI